MTVLEDGTPFVAGDDWVFTFTLEQDEEAVDLTSAESYSTSIAGVDGSITPSDPGNGEIEIAFDHQDNANLAHGLYRGDVKVGFSNGVVQTFGPYTLIVRRRHE